jgi:hypothetical protein
MGAEKTDVSRRRSRRRAAAKLVTTHPMLRPGWCRMAALRVGPLRVGLGAAGGPLPAPSPTSRGLDAWQCGVFHATELEASSVPHRLPHCHRGGPKTARQIRITRAVAATTAVLRPSCPGPASARGPAGYGPPCAAPALRLAQAQSFRRRSLRTTQRRATVHGAESDRSALGLKSAGPGRPAGQRQVRLGVHAQSESV